MRPHFENVLNQLNLSTLLRDYHPVVIGTPPLGLGIPSSDIDVACSATDLQQFATFVSHHFQDKTSFQCRTIEIRGEPAVVASFETHGWEVELFCQSKPTESQMGVRHFLIEKRLLDLEHTLRPIILALKQSGLKTEPAFAQFLGLQGDPYESLLTLETATDAELTTLITSSRNRRHV